MDSRRIVDVLERLQPIPPLHLDSPYQARIENLTKQIVDSIRPVFMPLVPKVFLNPTSRDYFLSTRTKALGMSLDEYAKGADEGVQKAKPYIRELGEMLRENNEGPFLQGKTPCYADMVVLAWLTMLDRLGVGDRIFGLEDGGEELKRLYDEGIKQGWFDRDSY
jgi:glutathione S-transferase